MYLDEVKYLEKFIERGEKQIGELGAVRIEIDQITEDLEKSLERARIKLAALHSSRMLPEPSRVNFMSIEYAE